MTEFTPIDKNFGNNFNWVRHPALLQCVAALQFDDLDASKLQDKDYISSRLAEVTPHEFNAMFVGGAVRDSFKGHAPDFSDPDSTDIDMACSLPPKESLRRLKQCGIRTIGTGLQHGTITALIDDIPIEITTLRIDQETDGRHAEVAFTTDWRLDAMRRDFTINAMYMTASGYLYDPMGGREDLQNGTVKFIGDAATRLREDYLRILRFFRFSQRYAEYYDSDGLTACASYVENLAQISAERIQSELGKILRLPKLVPTLAAMQESGVLPQIFSGIYYTPRFDLLEGLQKDRAGLPKTQRPSIWCLLLPIIDGQTPDKLQQKFKLSNQTAKDLHLTQKAMQAMQRLSNDTQWHDTHCHDFPWRALVYKYDNANCAMAYCWLTRENNNIPYTEVLDIIHATPKLTCPVTGKYLQTLGMKAGPEMGRILNLAEQAWLSENCADDFLDSWEISPQV